MRPYVPGSESEETAPSTPPKTPQQGTRRGPARPYVPGRGADREAPAGGGPTPSAAPPVGPEPEYIELNISELLSPEEIPSAVADAEALSYAHGGGTPGREAPEGGAPGLGSPAEDLLRMTRELELDQTPAQILEQLKDEADSPATRDLVEAAFGAGYFAGKGELERRVGTGR